MEGLSLMLLWRLSLGQQVSKNPLRQGCLGSEECPPGSDAMLVDVVDTVLKAAELPSSLLTGRTPWVEDKKY